MRLFRRYILIPVVLFAFYLAFYFFYWEAQKNTIQEFNKEQLILAQTASKGISLFLDSYKLDLNYLANLNSSFESDSYKELLQNYYLAHKDVIKAITLVDSNATICYTFPYDSTAMWQDISDQKHIQEVFSTHKTVISDVFLSVQGYYTLALHVPVFKENKFKGSLAVLIPINKLGQLFLDEIGLDKNGHAWLITDHNTEIYCRIDGHEGKSFLETTANDKKTLELLEKTKTNQSGSGVSIHQDATRLKNEELEDLYVVYHRFPIGSTYWTILISYEKKIVYQALSNFRTRLVFIILIMLVAAIYYYYSLAKVRIVLREETKRKKAEQLLKDNQIQLRAIINTIPDYIWLKDEKGVYLLCNNRFEDFFGAKEKDIINKTDYDFVNKDLADFFRANDLSAMHAKKPTTNEEQITLAKDGRKVNLETIKTPLLNSKNELVGVLGIARDITSRNQQEKELKTAKEKAEENDRLKSAFLANISHEIRTPMNGIMGFTQLLGDKDFSDDEKKSFIEIIEKSGQRMLNTINDIIDISKIESGHVDITNQEIDIEEIIDFNYQFFKPEADKKGLSLHIVKSITSYKNTIFTDKEKLTTIISNLIKNAIKYTDKGFVEVKYKIEKNDLVIRIKDSGIGIPNDRLDAIFERFIQADIYDKDSREGSGLGLAIIKAYTKMLNGHISVESIVDEGSTFSLILPLKPEQDS